MNTALLTLKSVSKRFTLHHQHGVVLQVLDDVNLEVRPGECVVLAGPSGQGKSTLLKLIYANYRASAGSITVTPPGAVPVELGAASPRALLRLRRDTIGYVSQFLRVIPRVSALDVVAESVQEELGAEAARALAAQWLARLAIPERLWNLPPATFSGGEQQRVNIARNLVKPRALLLLDEPTASLDAANAATVVALVREALAHGAAVVGIFHDNAIGQAVATRMLDMRQFKAKP